MTSAHRLDWDDLDLVNADNGSGLLPYWFETLAEGYSLGSPQARKIIVANLMRDGSDSRIDGHDNRTITFRVTVCGPDLAALAAGERALVLQSAALRSNLSWTPPDGFGATTVFTVLNTTLDPVADDLAEVRSGTKRRAYDITFECQPFGRSVDLTTVGPTSVLSSALFTADIGGSVRAPGSITVTRGSGTLVDLFVFSDPAMAEYGYHPDTPATWHLAPAGRYAFYMNPSTPTGFADISLGSVAKTTITSNGHSQTLRTRVPGSLDANTRWFPMGTADLGGNRDGLVGALTFLNRHDPPAAAEETMHSETKLRMFRVKDGETSLTRANGAAFARPIIIDIPSLEFPRGGVWANGVDILPNVSAWGLPLMAPPEAALFVADSTSGSSALSVTAEYFKHWHTYAGE